MTREELIEKVAKIICCSGNCDEPSNCYAAMDESKARAAIAVVQKQPVSDEMVARAMKRSQQKDLDLLTNDAAMRKIIEAALDEAI